MKVRTKDDILALLKELKPENRLTSPNSTITATFREGDKDIVLTAETVSKSKREIILDGLERLKKLVDHQENTKSTAYLEHIIKATHPVDTDIKNLLGARRCGIDIVWNLPSGYYVYNIYNHTLVRQDNAPEN